MVDHMTSAQNPNPIGQPVNLLEVVTDHQDAEPLVPQSDDHFFDGVRLADAEGCGWLIEDDDLGTPGGRSRYGNRLALSPRQ
jgi:hypothetical protein